MLQYSKIIRQRDWNLDSNPLSKHKRFESEPLQLISPVKSISQEKQLQELRKIREKLEYYNEGDRKKPFDQIVEEMEFKTKRQPVHPDPVQSTLKEIDKLMNDYVNSGMRDQVYLNSLHRLRQGFLQKSIPTGYYVRPVTKFQQHLPQQSMTDNGSYTKHPIYQYLPDGFKSELRAQNSLPVLNRQKTDDSGSVTEKMLSFMRNEENDAVRGNNLSRLTNIQAIKTSIEDEMVRERINKLAEQMTYKRSHVQNEDETVPYSHLEGLQVQWDLISKLPIQCTKARLSFGIFRQDENFHPYKQTNDTYTQAESYRTNKIVINKIEQMRDIRPDDKTVLYIELWIFDTESEYVPKCMGWTVLKLFDRSGGLYIGSYKLPIYSKQFNPNDLLMKSAVYPYVGNIMMYFRVTQPAEHNEEMIFVESEYHIPHYHIHREFKIVRPEFKEEIKPKIDYKLLAYDKPLREREPQLFGDPISPPKRQSVKPKIQVNDQEFFGDEKQQQESPTTSVQLKYQVKSRFSKKNDSIEHLPTQDKNSQQSSEPVIKLNSLASIPQVDNKLQRETSLKIQFAPEDQSSYRRNNDNKVGESTKRAAGDRTIRGGDRTVRGDMTSKGGQTNRHLLLKNQQESSSVNIKQFNKLKKRQKAEEGNQTSRSQKRIQTPPEVDLGSNKNQAVVVSGAGIVVINIIKLSSLEQSKFGELKLKIGFFIKEIILKDTNETDCVLTQNLIPTEIAEKFQKFNFHSEFSLDYPNIFSIFEEEGSTTNNAYIYFAIYQNNALLGWYVAQLFMDTQNIQDLQIKSGLFSVNLIKPPGQQAPFNEKDMIKSNIQLDFILMSKNEQLKNLPIVNEFKIQAEQKIRDVSNPEWNTQIVIQLVSAFNFASKDELQITMSIQYESKVINDVLQRPCESKDELDLFTTDQKGVFNSHYYTPFRVGTKYLKDSFNKLNQLNYIIIIHQNGAFLGMTQMTLFKKNILQVGEYRMNLYSINNKKLTLEIKILIKESPLQLDLFERTPSYKISKMKGGYTQHEEEQVVKSTTKIPTSRFSQITIHVSEVQVKNKKVVVKLIKGNDIIKQQNDDDCIQELMVPNCVVFCVDLDEMVKSKDNYNILIEIYDEFLIGWYAMNMIFNKKLYTTKLYTETYRPPRLQIPIDYKQVKKMKEKLEFQIHYGDVRADIRKQNQKQKSGVDVCIHWIHNLPNNGDNQIVIQLISDGKVIQDKLFNLCQTKQNLNIVNGSIKDLIYNYHLKKSDLPTKCQLAIYISQQNVEIRWCVISLYALGQVKEGRVEKKMFLPPFNKTNKPSNTDICIEIE